MRAGQRSPIYRQGQSLPVLDDKLSIERFGKMRAIGSAICQLLIEL